MPEQLRIEFCYRNADRATAAWLTGLDQTPGLSVQGRGCLCHCTRCFESPFLRVNGRDIEGPTHQTILEEVTRLSTNACELANGEIEVAHHVREDAIDDEDVNP